MSGAAVTITTGAVTGAGASFVGTLVATGDLGLSGKAALGGALTGGVAGAVASAPTIAKFLFESVAGGLANEVQGGQFADGLFRSMRGNGLRLLYTKVAAWRVEFS